MSALSTRRRSAGRAARKVLEGSRLAKDQALPTGEGDFCAVLKHEDIAHQVDDAGVLDVFEIDNAIAPGAKELCRVEPLLAVSKGATDEHGGTDPVDTAVISFRFQSEQVGHAKNATLDVVGENDEIVVSKRNVAGEFVKNFARFRLGAVILLDRGRRVPYSS